MKSLLTHVRLLAVSRIASLIWIFGLSDRGSVTNTDMVVRFPLDFWISDVAVQTGLSSQPPFSFFA